jgi:hypothetical protein
MRNQPLAGGPAATESAPRLRIFEIMPNILVGILLAVLTTMFGSC